jgi:hypothetical protein
VLLRRRTGVFTQWKSFSTLSEKKRVCFFVCFFVYHAHKDFAQPLIGNIVNIASERSLW